MPAFSPQANLDEMTDSQWDHIFNVNTKSTFISVQEVLKYMTPRRYGRIVITTSITGSHTGYPGWAHYGASKAAQQGFMKGAALEVARDGITINGVLPGNILTEGLRDHVISHYIVYSLNQYIAYTMYHSFAYRW